MTDPGPRHSAACAGHGARVLRSVPAHHRPAPLMAARFLGFLLPAHPANFKVGWPPGPFIKYTKVVHFSELKSKPRRAELQLETADAHAPGHVRTNVRREHQAPTHARSSEESTERTVHIQQWGSHPLSLAGGQGPANLFAN